MGGPATIGELTLLITNVIRNAIYLAGVGVIAMLVVGGFQYLTAGGDKEAAQKASKTITYAIAGLVIVICSWLIIQLLGNFLGFDSTSQIFNFNVCLPGNSGPNCTH